MACAIYGAAGRVEQPRLTKRPWICVRGLPGNYLQATRVAIAKEMLEDGARSVQAVSAAVGYDDAAFFRNIFKRCTGMTPGEYRQNFAGLGSVRASLGRSRPGMASNGMVARGG